MTADKNTTGLPARTTVRLPEHLHHRAKLAAAWSGMKLQDFIAKAVEQHLASVEDAMDGNGPPGPSGSDRTS